MSTFWLSGLAGAARDAAMGPGMRSGDEPSSGAVHTLECRLERLEMVCEALWELLKDQLELTDEQLVGRIAELDLSDGAADGRVSRGPQNCPQCKRPNARRHDFCIYCGALVRTKPF